MSRIRTIKPEFWASEQVTNLSRDTRLLFIGIWNFSDDSGIHSRSPKRLKGEVFPHDEDISTDDIERSLKELVVQSLIVDYEVNGEKFIRVTGWGKHQKIDKPTFKFPWPCGTIPSEKAQLNSLFDDYSTNAIRVLDPGKERIG